MKAHTLQHFVLLGLGLLITTINAQEEIGNQRSSRQSDFVDFPGPRRQTPATLPVFNSDGGRGRSQFRPSLIDSGEGELIDDRGFQHEEPPPPPPRQSFRSSGGDRPRFSSRPQFSQDDGSGGDLGGRVKVQGAADGLEEEKKEAEVDRLALLLQDSKFQCTTKKPGYYADDGLNCQVFHYCNEGVRHSWMCPDGTLFHQIHLICMAEGGDNICKQSTKFHFVNDYLYKPLQQSTRDSNGTVRYADRYFPVEGGEVQQEGGGFQGGRPQQSLQDDPRDFTGPSHGGSFRPSRPQPEDQFDFSQPPSRSSSGGGGGGAPQRFRPSFDEEFGAPQSQFSNDGHGQQPQHQGGADDLGVFGSSEDQFQPAPPARVRGRPSGRGQGFPSFGRS